MTKQEKIERNQKIVEEYINTPNHLKNLSKLGEKFGLKTLRAVSKILKDAGVEIYNTSHHTSINEHIFDTIDTEEKAYWLGFMYADGCIYSKENRIELSLQDLDVNHLYKFAKFLDSKKEDFVKSYKNYKHGKYNRCRVSFRSKVVWEALNSKGCVPNKSLILTFPDESVLSDKSLIRHFIRGYVDGDGCLCYTKGKAEFNVLGTEEFLTGLMENLPLDRKYPVYKKHKDTDKNFCIFNLWCSTAVRIMQYLYENATIYLDRKYEKYKEICRLYEESYRGLEGNIGEGCDANTEITKESNNFLVS